MVAMKLCAAGLSVGLLLGAAEVWGHGRFPAAGSFVVDPAHADRFWVRTTYGMLVTADRGESWKWVCSEAAGYNADGEDPSLVLSGDGSAIVGTFSGLSVSHDGCVWNVVGDELAGRYFVFARTTIAREVTQRAASG